MKNRFNLLDIYRGIAALLVVMYHITLETYNKFHFVIFGNIFRQGNIGVDFFFVLSGFIIFYIHNKDAGNFSQIMSFFKKRAIRIFPSYWTITTIILTTFFVLQSFIVNKPPFTITYLLATYTLFPHAFRLIPASWTLTEELYFYLLFGLLLFIRPVRIRLSLFILLGIALFTGSFFIAHTTQPIAEEFITPYILEFISGCIAGYIFSSLIRYVKKSTFIVIVILGIALYTTTLLPKITLIRIPIIALSFSLIVWATASYEASYSPRFNKYFLLIGQASYVIYLSHAFIIQILYKFLYSISIPHISLLFNVIAIGSFTGCIILSVIFYIYYEKPLLKLLRKKLL